VNNSQFHRFDGEAFLAKRLKDRGREIFIGTTDTAERMRRFRIAITDARLMSVVVGTNLAGKTETYADLFARIYDEPLEPKPSRGKL
jgi:hypothetical protein